MTWFNLIWRRWLYWDPAVGSEFIVWSKAWTQSNGFQHQTCQRSLDGWDGGPRGSGKPRNTGHSCWALHWQSWPASDAATWGLWSGTHWSRRTTTKRCRSTAICVKVRLSLPAKKSCYSIILLDVGIHSYEHLLIWTIACGKRTKVYCDEYLVHPEAIDFGADLYFAGVC